MRLVVWARNIYRKLMLMVDISGACSSIFQYLERERRTKGHVCQIDETKEVADTFNLMRFVSQIGDSILEKHVNWVWNLILCFVLLLGAISMHLHEPNSYPLMSLSLVVLCSQLSTLLDCPCVHALFASFLLSELINYSSGTGGKLYGLFSTFLLDCHNHSLLDYRTNAIIPDVSH
jgi:hypothetical protein